MAEAVDADFSEAQAHIEAILPGRRSESVRWALQQVEGNVELAVGLLLDAEIDVDACAELGADARREAEAEAGRAAPDSAPSIGSSDWLEEDDVVLEVSAEQGDLLASTGPPSPGGSSGPSEWSFQEEDSCEELTMEASDLTACSAGGRQEADMPDELFCSPGASSSSSGRVSGRRFSSAAVSEDVALAVPGAAPWEVLNPDGVEHAWGAEIDRVNEVLGVSAQAARVLLAHFGFDADRVLESYADNPERTLGRAGLPADVMIPGTCAGNSQSSGRMASCGSCLEDLPAHELLDLSGCGHSFCKTCCKTFLLMKVKEGESCRLRCMSYKCGRVCNDNLVLDLLTGAEPDAALRFKRSLIEAYVSDNRTGLVKWCPSAPHCGNAVRLVREASVGLLCEVVCDCSHRFCFSCLEEAHSPCSCEMLKSWGQKEAGESATSKWLLAHAKPCPRCKNPVEKNGGCNHVMCRCGQSFCWHCGQATGTAHTWDSIVDHTCGRFKDDAAEQARQAEKDLNRYLHYYNRWRSHMNSLKFEAEQEAKVSEKIEGLISRLPSYLESYAWLREGAAQLSACRRVLAYSYIFAYYAFGPQSLFADEVSPNDDQINRNLYEMKQEELEKAVENLSKFVETPLEDMLKDDAITKIKQAVLDLTVNVDSRSLRLCETVQNDILGRLATSHGIAPYRARTQVVQREQMQHRFTSAVACAASSTSGAMPVSSAGSFDAPGAPADEEQRPRKRLRVIPIETRRARRDKNPR